MSIVWIGGFAWRWMIIFPWRLVVCIVGCLWMMITMSIGEFIKVQLFANDFDRMLQLICSDLKLLLVDFILLSPCAIEFWRSMPNIWPSNQ
jgi:hypothetical protein